MSKPAPDATTTPEAKAPATTPDEIVVTPEKGWHEKIWDPETPGKFVPKWQELLPDDFEDHKAMLANYGDLGTVAKSLKDLTRLAREKGNVKPLTDESSPEDVAAYRKALGIPDSPYEFAKPEQLPEGVEWREDRIKNFGEWAQKENLTPAQAKKALDLHVQYVAEDQKRITEMQKQAYDQNIAAEKEALRTQFGGKLDRVVTSAKQVAIKYDIPVEMMEPNSPHFVGVTMLKVFNDMAAALGESKLPTAAATLNTDPLRQAKGMRQKGHPDYDAMLRGDKAAMDKYYGLLRMAKEQGLI